MRALKGNVLCIDFLPDISGIICSVITATKSSTLANEVAFLVVSTFSYCFWIVLIQLFVTANGALAL